MKLRDEEENQEREREKKNSETKPMLFLLFRLDITLHVTIYLGYPGVSLLAFLGLSLRHLELPGTQDTRRERDRAPGLNFTQMGGFG